MEPVGDALYPFTTLELAPTAQGYDQEYHSWTWSQAWHNLTYVTAYQKNQGHDKRRQGSIG